MEMATEHLLALGHRRIALIGGSPAISTGRERLAGYLKAHEARGLPVDRALILACDTNRRGGMAAIQQALALESPPTAAACFADIIAFGVMLELSRQGLEPGRDFSVIGFDDVIEAACGSPPLTTVRSAPRHGRRRRPAPRRADRDRVAPAAPHRVRAEPHRAVELRAAGGRLRPACARSGPDLTLRP
jgi:LacI family transcriptional regulator